MSSTTTQLQIVPLADETVVYQVAHAVFGDGPLYFLTQGATMAILVLAANTSGVLAHVLTIFPLTAPLVLPARSALVGVPIWEHVLAVVLVLGSIYAIVRFAGRVYAHGLLRSGPRLGIRAAWRITDQS